MKSKVVAIALAVAVALVAGRSSARAQSSTAQAEALFRQGKELIAKGKFAEACAAFDASQKLDPTLATLLNQASCREKNGQLATAWGLFLDAERQSRTGADDNTRKLHQVAIDHAAQLEPRLSTLTISVPADSRVGGLEVLRNNEPIDPGAWNKALPVDGGVYKITARAPGNAAWSSSVTVGAERDAKSIEIPKLKAAELAAAPAPTAPSPTPEPSAPVERPRSLVLPLVFGAAAVGLVGGAVGVELWARSTYDKSKREPDNTKQDSLWHSANTRRYVATGLGIAGLACAGTALYLYLRPPTTESTSTLRQAHHARSRPVPQPRALVPLLAPDHAGLALVGTY